MFKINELNVGNIALKNAEEKDRISKNYKIALEMDKRGKSNEEIFVATNWHKGLDNKWKFTLRYPKFSFKPQIEKLYKKSKKNNLQFEMAEMLGDVFNDNPYFKFYPFLKRLILFFNIDPKSDKTIFDIHFNPNRKEIVYTTNEFYTLNKVYEIILHEIQHYIQKKEDFSHGTNRTYESGFVKTILNDKEDMIHGLATFSSYISNSENNKFIPFWECVGSALFNNQNFNLSDFIKETHKKNFGFSEIENQIRKNVWNFKNNSELFDNIGKLLYSNNIGEIEARESVKDLVKNKKYKKQNKDFTEMYGDKTYFVSKNFKSKEITKKINFLEVWVKKMPRHDTYLKILIIIKKIREQIKNDDVNNKEVLWFKINRLKKFVYQNKELMKIKEYYKVINKLRNEIKVRKFGIHNIKK